MITSNLLDRHRRPGDHRHRSSTGSTARLTTPSRTRSPASAPSGVWVNTLLDSSNYLLTKVHANKAFPGKWIVTQRHRDPGPDDPVRLRRRRDVQRRRRPSGAGSTCSRSATRATAIRRCRTSPRTISTASSTARSPRATASTAAILSPSFRVPQQDLRASDHHRHRHAPTAASAARRSARCTAATFLSAIPRGQQPVVSRPRRRQLEPTERKTSSPGTTVIKSPRHRPTKVVIHDHPKGPIQKA